MARQEGHTKAREAVVTDPIMSPPANPCRELDVLKHDLDVFKHDSDVSNHGFDVLMTRFAIKNNVKID